MKYKNKTDEVIKFRAHNKKGIVHVFELQPDEDMESDRTVEHPGLELIKDTTKVKDTEVK